mgnify:CR=1 FL=1
MDQNQNGWQAPLARDGLTPQQETFARLYAAGPLGIRNNLGRAWMASGSKAKDVGVAARYAAQALKMTPALREYIAELEMVAQAEAIRKLRDWKELAPDAQEAVIAVMQGMVPDGRGSYRQVTLMEDVKHAEVVLKASMAIIERAYPIQAWRRQELLATDAKARLAALLGVRVDQLPPVLGPLKQVGPPGPERGERTDSNEGPGPMERADSLEDEALDAEPPMVPDEAEEEEGE